MSNYILTAEHNNNLSALHADQKQYGVNYCLPWLCVVQRNLGVLDKKLK